MGRVTVGDLACARSGDKGTTLDLTFVARDESAYRALVEHLTADVVAACLGLGAARRHELPRLLALKFVLPDALDAGPWASRRAGIHWQKAAVSPLLALEIGRLGGSTAIGGAAADEGRGEGYGRVG